MVARYRPGRGIGWLILILTIVSIVSGCQSGGGEPEANNNGKVIVNGFGTAANHVHSLLVNKSDLLVLATHYGSYRSVNGGKRWKQVSGAADQLMQGLMNYSLSASEIDLQRMYLLTQPAINAPSGEPGLYTSVDQGKTWLLVQATAAFKTDNLYFVAAGNGGAEQVYLYLPAQGAEGLKVSQDAGKHFSETGKLPFGRILGLVPLPGEAGKLLAYSSDGVARSEDSGKTWEVVKSIQGGIYSMTSAGKGSLIYASGDAGVYSSRDGGASFTVVSKQAAYGALAVAATQPEIVYGKTGTAVYRSRDGGKTWSALPALKGNLGNLVVDPQNAEQLYVTLSYPAQVYRLNIKSNTWEALTPEAEK